VVKIAPGTCASADADTTNTNAAAKNPLPNALLAIATLLNDPR
jgi:hypothetical protein